MSTFRGRTYGVRGTRRSNAGRVHDADLLRAAEDILVQARDLRARWNALGLQTRTAKNYRDAIAWVLESGAQLRTWAMTGQKPTGIGHVYVPSGMARVMRAELRKAARWIGQREVDQGGEELRENPGGGKWYVYVDGHHEETAFFDPEMTKEEVVRALVDEGYDEKTLEVRQSYRDRITDPRRNPSRRANPALAILNPLPAHLEEFARAQRLTADERREFNEAIARYCEFHDVDASEVAIEPWGEVEGDGTRFLVGLGKAEDVSYSVNTKGKFTGSNKKGIPFRHKIEARDTVLASTPDGEMTIILNKPGAAKRMVVRDWLRG